MHVWKAFPPPPPSSSVASVAMSGNHNWPTPPPPCCLSGCQERRRLTVHLYILEALPANSNSPFSSPRRSSWSTSSTIGSSDRWVSSTQLQPTAGSVFTCFCLELTFPALGRGPGIAEQAIRLGQSPARAWLRTAQKAGAKEEQFGQTIDSHVLCHKMVCWQNLYMGYNCRHLTFCNMPLNIWQQISWYNVKWKNQDKNYIHYFADLFFKDRNEGGIKKKKWREKYIYI